MLNAANKTKPYLSLMLFFQDWQLQFKYSPLDQLVDRLTLAQEVGGSSPPGITKSFFSITAIIPVLYSGDIGSIPLGSSIDYGVCCLEAKDVWLWLK